MAEPKLRMADDSYLAFDRASDIKHELWDGDVHEGVDLTTDR